jgi:hypothetical protein
MASADERFEQLKEKLHIDMAAMDQELVELPQFIQEVSEWVAGALSRRDQANNDLKLAMADEADRMRNSETKKPSEKQIEADVLLTKSVRDATIKLENAKYQLSLWQGLMDSARAKSDAIQVLGKLWIAGYVTTDTISRSGRAELAEQRRQRPALQKRGTDNNGT